MSTIASRKLAEKEVVLEYKASPLVEKIVDGEKKLIPGHEVPVVTVRMRELTCREAMEADDFCLAESKTGQPSISRMLKMYGIFSVVWIKDEHAPHGETVSPKSNPVEYEKFTDRITNKHANILGNAYNVFATEIAVQHDPKNSPSDKP